MLTPKKLLKLGGGSWSMEWKKKNTQANWIIVYTTLPDNQGWIFQMYHIMLTSKLGVYFNGDAWLCTAQQRLILQNRCLITCHATRSDLSIVKSFVFIIRHWVFCFFFQFWLTCITTGASVGSWSAGSSLSWRWWRRLLMHHHFFGADVVKLPVWS